MGQSIVPIHCREIGACQADMEGCDTLRGGTAMLVSGRITRMLLLFFVGIAVAAGQEGGAFRPEIPRVWDERALEDMEVPVVVPKYSPKPVSPAYYYKIPARTIYKSYPIYAPGRAVSGYLEKLKTLEPEIVFDATKLKTKEDWIRAGEVVFEAPTLYDEP